MSTRRSILTGVDSWLTGRHGAAAGTVSRTFRKSFKTPYLPGEKMRPAYHVSDNGGRRAGKGGSETTKDRMMILEITLLLDDDWSREGKYQAWQDLVEDIIDNLQNRTTVGPGVFRVDYLSDEPFEITTQKAASEAIWVIEFEISWAATVPALES